MVYVEVGFGLGSVSEYFKLFRVFVEFLGEVVGYPCLLLGPVMFARR